MNPMVQDPLAYFGQWIPGRSDLMQSLEKEAEAEQIPIVGPVVGQLLYLMARLQGARTIIELGTAIGYSTLFLATACRQTGGTVLSYDLSPGLVERARTNIGKAGYGDQVQLHCENGIEAMERLSAPVDMIFLDVDKQYYIDALPQCKRLLRSGGLLFADNTGFRDADRFNRAIHADDAWESVNLWCYLPGHSGEHDGLCLALKK